MSGNNNFSNYKVKSPKGTIYVYPYRRFCIKLSPVDAEYIDNVVAECSKAKGKRVSLPQFFMQVAKHYAEHMANNSEVVSRATPS